MQLSQTWIYYGHLNMVAYVDMFQISTLAFEYLSH